MVKCNNLYDNKNIDVIASSASGIYQHAVDSWIVDDDKLLRTDRSKISIQFDSVVNAWIEKYDYDHRKQLIDSTFELFEKSQIKMLSDITENKLKSLCVMIKTSNSIDHNFGRRKLWQNIKLKLVELIQEI